MDQLLESLSLDEVIEQALLNKPGILTDVYHLVTAYERVDWKELDRLTEKLKLDQDIVFSAYQEAQNWVNHIMNI